MRRIGLSILIFLLGLTACNSVPSQPSPIPSEVPTQPILQTPASPTPAAVLPITGALTGTRTATIPPTLTQGPTETQPPTPTEAPTLTPTAAQTPTPALAFDISKRTSHPPMDKATDFEQWMAANTPENSSFYGPKWARAQAIKATGEATDPRVFEAFFRTPRELFFEAPNPAYAYASAIFGIGYGQTIPGPHLVAHMVEAIDPQPNQKVLEIGTGSGYTSAFLSELSNYVYTEEIIPQLAQKDDALYNKLVQSYPEYANIHRKNADGYYGWPEHAPFDRIIVTAGIDHVPPDLLSQLTPNGIMVIPVGPPSGQTVLKITKQVQPDGTINFVREDIYHGMKIQFVPFTGGHQ